MKTVTAGQAISCYLLIQKTEQKTQNFEIHSLRLNNNECKVIPYEEQQQSAYVTSDSNTQMYYLFE